MLHQNLRTLLLHIAVGLVSTLPFSPAGDVRRMPEKLAVEPINNIDREFLSNSTSSRTSTTVFFAPHTSTTVEHSSVAPPLSGSTGSSVHGIRTVTVPWSPTSTSSYSVHIITITSPWPSITPTITVPIPLSSPTTPSLSVQTVTMTGSESPAPVVVTVTNSPEASVPAVVTVTSPPQQPVPEVVTVIDTTVTVYISSGILTVLPTVTVTATTPQGPDVVTVTAV
ncbi:hypothetical protein BR93DRAFT_979244 [Coniochaeta sp. PMI_546]|nr:hypothetical protein BR93DRAFT_979244 [Coniochaeta sp. PMI_546]